MHDEDRAVWVTWLDLPEQGRDAYFDWLHGPHIPRLLERPGYLWAAHYASLPHGDKVPRRHGKKFNTDDPSVPQAIASSSSSVGATPAYSAIRRPACCAPSYRKTIARCSRCGKVSASTS